MYFPMTNETNCHQNCDFSKEQILSALQSLLSHNVFARSPSVRKFLSFVVEERLNNPQASLKAFAIATTAFNRDSDFDPQDPYIRNIAREVRRTLEKYYRHPEVDDQIRIEIPVGTYTPKFTYNRVKKEPPRTTLDSAYISASNLEPTVAVLPFRSLIVGTQGNLYGELIADQLITNFSRLPDMQVISLLSTLDLTNTKNGLVRARDELSADFIIFGTYLESQGNLRVSMQVTDVKTQTVTQASIVNVALRDIVNGVSDLCEKLVKEIRYSIHDHEFHKGLLNDPLSLKSFTLKIASVRLMHRISKGDLQRSKKLLERLCDLNPGLAEPNALMGHWHILNHNQGWGSSQKIVAKNAQQYADRALDADPECSLALTIDAVVASNFHWDFERAEKMFEKAIETNPNNSLAWLLKGTMHTFRGEGELAVLHTRKAQRLSPLDPQKYYYDSLLASAELAAGNYNHALTLVESSYKLNKYHASTLRVKTMLLSILGRTDEALAAKNELLLLLPNFTVSSYRENLPITGTSLVDVCTTALLDAGVPQ